MARFDTSIYTQNPLRSIADYEAEFDAGALRKQVLAQNRLKMDDYQRGVQRDNELRSLYAGLGQDPQQNYQTLLKGAGPEAAGKYMKGIDESKKTAAETAAKDFETKAKRIQLVGSTAKFVMDNPTPENASAALDNLAANGIWTAEQAAQYKQMMLQNPALIQQQAQMLFQAAVDADKQLSTFTTRNTGGSTDTLAQNPVTGTVKPVNSVVNTQSPDNAASNARMAAEGAANRAVQMRGQDLTDARAGGQEKLPKPPKDMRYKADGSGELEPIPGSVTDAKRKKEVSAAKNFSRAASDKLDVIETNVDRMLQSPAMGGQEGGNLLDVATGIRGVVARRIPGSDAAGFEARKETILANLGFKELADMRAQSPTGGALGNVTEKELAYLQATVASLNAAQNDKDMRMALQDVKKALAQSRKRISEAASQDTGETNTGGWSIKKKP